MTYKENPLPASAGTKFKNFIKLCVLMAIAFLIIVLLLPYFDSYMMGK